MNINRSNYKELINYIETHLPVNEWFHNGYHIWPILRIRLFLMLVKKYEGSRYSLNNSELSVKEKLKKIKSLLDSWIYYRRMDNEITFIFCGAPAHRVDYLGKRYNRYFDPLMDNQSHKSLLIERDSDSKQNYYKPGRIFLISGIERWYNLKIKIAGTKNSRVDHFTKELILPLKKFGYEFMDFNVEMNSFVTGVDRSKSIYKKILQKTEPKKVYELCYYSASMLGLNIGAQELGIPTVDMQHGPQNKFHLAYGSWKNMPHGGYEALPNEFHTWDESFANNIHEWAKKTTKHSAIATGNPWVEGWKKEKFKSSKYRWPDNLILYSLQPTGDPLEPYLLETIKKTAKKWNWWLRLHPRQMNEREELENKLKKHGLLGHVNIQDATNLPLPEILINTSVHITKFSGCAAEAFYFGIPTVILDNRGRDMFKAYMDDALFISCLAKDDKLLITNIQDYMEKIS